MKIFRFSKWIKSLYISDDIIEVDIKLQKGIVSARLVYPDDHIENILFAETDIDPPDGITLSNYLKQLTARKVI